MSNQAAVVGNGMVLQLHPLPAQDVLAFVPATAADMGLWPRACVQWTTGTAGNDLSHYRLWCTDVIAKTWRLAGFVLCRGIKLRCGLDILHSELCLQKKGAAGEPYFTYI